MAMFSPLKAALSKLAGTRSTEAPTISHTLSIRDIVWAVGSLCSINKKSFDPGLLVQHFPPPASVDTLLKAIRAAGFKSIRRDIRPSDLLSVSAPFLVILNPSAEHIVHSTSHSDENRHTGDKTVQGEPILRPALVARIDRQEVHLFLADASSPVKVPLARFMDRFTGIAILYKPLSESLKGSDNPSSARASFGFRWFIPEIFKYKDVWRDILAASLVIQLLALATPLFTQVIIDKVVVHRTQSTLIVLGIGMAVFNVFSAVLSWVRQYLILHTGNRIDAVLGAEVFEHVFKLPIRFFEHRSTGVVAARLRGVENIREFLASASVTLMLDLPFLVIFIAIMFSYSPLLTAISLLSISVIAAMSLIVAPVFRSRLNQQFLLGARTQAFTTEYISGIETVKSLQMEPQLREKYGLYVAEYLSSGFGVRQIGNTYNVVANSIEQTMTLLILIVGAYLAMSSSDFTIGMLVAFQMFASRVSQPLLRLVSLWQQFQQASLSVARLGDIMNAPSEPYALLANRTRSGSGLLEIDSLGFRYNDRLPFLYENLSLRVNHGKTIAIMGPSGCGKSTLAKLLLGFYQPVNGCIKLDGVDIRYLSANELRLSFGVVPQETILFSGTIYENLQMANPNAGFEQIVRACRTAEVHSVIESLPDGYQTEIGERGIGLSGGQRQRLAIARALLKRPRILIFDEATSNLDAETAEHFGATVNQLRGKVSMLFITHALPKTLIVDEIVRLGRNGSLDASASDENTRSQLAM